ncbi:peptidoglycan DD-metalloendopeptidase family protein [Fulvivirgaceae bacterium BMA10]|uniref:Peptidoglycan DD-metalloendopeptidase family protein n=1 Tax=Splendidivirga corallicola TaxID=3051826 RepID=A0ABT8KLL1_9BACT|nr:peptidoglycan DD-metalloendopeptidase family protein [Fulvivirgaceae bacterium BMA10]
MRLENNLYIFLFFIFFSLIFHPSLAQKSRPQLEKEKQEAVKKIQEAEKILAETEVQKQASLGQLNALNQLITTRKSLIGSIKKELRLLNGEINELDEIQRAMEKDLDNLKKEYALMLYTSSKSSVRYNKLVLLFSAGSFNQFFKRLKYLEQYGEARTTQVKQIELVKNELIAQKDQVEAKRTEKKQLLRDEIKENNNLLSLQKKQQGLLSSLNNKESELKRELAQQRKAAKRLDKLIADVVKKQMAAPAKVVASGAITSKSFEGTKSKMSWPVSGFISHKFGRQKHQTLKGIVVNNNGIDIQTKENEKVRSVFDGQVAIVSLVPGIGTAVIIKHGEYFTVYSKMKNVTVKTGQEVKAGEILGEVYKDKTGVSELEFQVWKKDKKLDPQVWLVPK